jgi:protein-S-isoprenylcysteine O-methyltransferase Ste14
MNDDFFKIVFVIYFVMGCLIRIPFARRSKKVKSGTDQTPRIEKLLFVPIFFGMQILPFVYLLTGWLDFADYRFSAWIGVVGAIVFVIALWLLWRSHIDLGGNFSVKLRIREEHSLVTGGVYSRIRHPMYAAHLLWAIAQVLLLHNWIAGPAFLVTSLPLYLLRIPREEKMMLENFGEDYRLYTKRTGRVAPPMLRYSIARLQSAMIRDFDVPEYDARGNAEPAGRRKKP